MKLKLGFRENLETRDLKDLNILTGTNNFINGILEQYDALKNIYMNMEIMPDYEDLGCRDGFKFFELCVAHKFCKTEEYDLK